MSKKNAISSRYNIRENIDQMINELSVEYGISKSSVIEKAISEMYNRDTVDENILLARMATIERKMGYTDKKVETLSGLLVYVLPLIFAGLPALPKGKDERQMILDAATQRMEEAVRGYRKYKQKTGLSFMQSVYGDSLEALEEPMEKEIDNGEKEHHEAASSNK